MLIPSTGSGRVPSTGSYVRLGGLPSPAAFSLLELLITLALLIILVTIWHGFGSRNNQQRQLKACQKNLQEIYLAMEIYANEHDGRFPALSGARTPEEPLSILIPQYTTASSSFICPGSKDSPIPSAEPLTRRHISYAYFMGRLQTNPPSDVLMSDRLLDASPKPKGAQAFSATGRPPGNNHHKYGGNFLFVDGRQESASGPIPFALTWPADVTLLNPER
ncbi:MAG TPA: hypothetical protein VNU68_00950 [Verrucomicrobiae bacterium]|nr:hypothetical protein [Verrucomicrobiae bacterium]